MHATLIDSVLEYPVNSPSHCAFHLEAAFHEGHEVEQERLSVPPAMKVRTFCDERSGNRFIRLDAPKGALLLNYCARDRLRADRPPGARRHRPRCQGRGVCNHFW